MNDSLVSIGLPTYNRQSVIRRALDSLLRQTYQNLEIIISDDGSKDDTEKIIDEYKAKDNRIKYFKQDVNLGNKKNFYFVLEKSTGEYFMRAADDDWWNKNCVEKLVGALETHREYAIAVSSFDCVYNNGEIEWQQLFQGDNELTPLSNYQLYRRVLLRKRGMDHINYGVIKTDLLKKVLSKLYEGNRGWDAILCAELVMASRVYSIPVPMRNMNNRIESPGMKSRQVQSWGHLNEKKFPFTSSTYANLYINSLRRVWGSRAIPLHRKVFAIFPWLSAFWAKRAKFFGFLYSRI